MRRAAFLACLLAVSLHSVAHGQRSGVNVPLLPGVPHNPDPHSGDPQKDALTKSDLLWQRQLEVEIVESTRNPQHLLAFFNDYRAVDIDPNIEEAPPPMYQVALSGLMRVVDRVLAWFRGRPPESVPPLPRYAAAAEATIGMSRSSDGGQTWTGALVPGSVDDTSAASVSSPLYGLQAMTDPAPAPGPCGIVYVGVIAFTRGDISTVAVARWQDMNHVDGSETWYYQGTSVIETAKNAANGQFHDLLRVVVDPVRGQTSDPCAHNVYVGWARFNGFDSASTLNFARTTAGNGPTWNPVWNTKFITSTDKVNQGVTMAVDPLPGLPNNGGGTLYYAWRVFASQAMPARYWITWSKDFGATFEKPVVVTGTSPVYPYDQPTLASDMPGVGPAQVAFRSNSLPTLAVVPNHPTNPTGSRIFMAWQERVNVLTGQPDPLGDPRIVITRSDNGRNWSQRTTVDVSPRDIAPPEPGQGYLPQERPAGPQIMPRLAYGGGRFALFYYEARGPLTEIPPHGGVIAGMDRQIDARMALLDPGSGLAVGSSQVSRYALKVGANLDDGETRDDVVEAAPGVKAINERLNHTTSGGGHVPFAGDYNGMRPIVTLMPGATPNAPWRWAIRRTDVPFQAFRAVWADSRNQIPPPGTPEEQLAQYPFYSPPGLNVPSCINPGSRNIDGFYSLVDATVTVSTPTTYKQANIERAFPLTIGNPTAGQTFYQLTFDKPSIASWNQNDPTQDPQFDTLNVELFPHASSTRTAYVSATQTTEAVKVLVRQITLGGPNCGQTLVDPDCTINVGDVVGTATLNFDPTNPPYTGTDGDATSETHDPLLSDPVVTNPLVANPLVANPLVANPLVANPLVANPLVANPLVANATIHDMTDTTWTVQNGGTSASAYLNALNVGNLDALLQDDNYAFQLLIYKKAMVAGLSGCQTINVPMDQIISSVPNPLVANPLVANPLVANPLVANPLVANPLVANATFAEEPYITGETGDFHDGTRHDFRPSEVFVTLRAYQLKPTAQLPIDPVTGQPAKFDPRDHAPAFAVHAHARNVRNGQKDQGPPPFAAKGSDLVASGTFDAATVTAGFTLDIPVATVTNNGNLRSGRFRYGYYLSSDAIIDRTDTLLLAGSVLPKLEPDQSNTAGPATVTIPSTTPGGSYFYGILFDDTGHVGETDETNNYVSAPITIESQGTIDQQQPLIDAAAGTLAIGGPAAQKVAQVVTAGLSRSLSNVLLAVSCSPDATLTLQIEGVSNRGLPNGVVSSTTTYVGGSSSSAGGGFFDYPLGTALPMVSGQKFAIVLSAGPTGSCSTAQGPTGDPYKMNGAFSDSTVVTPGVWEALPSRRDFPFKTVVK
jgi:hypothetical protein